MKHSMKIVLAIAVFSLMGGELFAQTPNRKAYNSQGMKNGSTTTKPKAAEKQSTSYKTESQEIKEVQNQQWENQTQTQTQTQTQYQEPASNNTNATKTGTSSAPKKEPTQNAPAKKGEQARFTNPK